MGFCLITMLDRRHDRRNPDVRRLKLPSLKRPVMGHREVVMDPPAKTAAMTAEDDVRTSA
jgi:hypothetical protein